MLASEVQTALLSLLMGVRARDLEGENLDFKRPARDVKETLHLLADAAVCFANARGGFIVLGVDDKSAGEQALTDVPPVITSDLVRRGIFDRTRPSLTCFVTDHLEAGRRLIVVGVPECVGTCSNAAGTATRRLGKDCLPFSPDQQREVLIGRGQLDWSAGTTDATLEDVDPLEVERMRRLLRQAGRRELADLALDRLLEALRLVAGTQVTGAALVLIGTEESLERFVPTYGYSYQFRDTAGVESVNRWRGRRPLLAAVDALMGAVESRRLVHSLNLPGGVQLQLSDYPLDAVRELVVNGLVHRSYETQGTVDLEHTTEHLTLASPGGLVAGVTPANILTYPSTPRNRLLTEAVATLQLAERTGQGIDRVYREMLRSGKEPPAFDDEGALVRARLAGGVGNDAFVRYANSLPDPLDRDVDVLLALSLLRRRRTIDAVGLSQVIQRTPAEGLRVLQRLTEHRIVEATRRTANRQSPTYRLRADTVAILSRALAYQRRQVDEADEKIIEHLREYGFITNRTVQRLFDIGVFPARNMLSDLRARGLLDKIGDARGGPGVRYGPGRSFPR